jgi:hypothetical protein
LKVEIHARMWDDDQKAFGPDAINYKDGYAEYTLGCPNFKKLNVPFSIESEKKQEVQQALVTECISTEMIAQLEDQVMSEKRNQEIVFRFFRKLDSAQRLSILVDLGAISEEDADQFNHSLERRVLDRLLASDRANEIEMKINNFLLPNIGENKE